MTKEIKLTRGKTALVDDDMYEYLNQWKWCCDADGYAVRSYRADVRKYKAIRMHRLIANTPDGLQTDHIDGNKLNNQKQNLRNCNCSQNQANTRKASGASSLYKGVSWSKRKQKWESSVKVNGKSHFLGFFTSQIEAARAYDQAAKKYFGEFAYLNFQR